MDSLDRSLSLFAAVLVSNLLIVNAVDSTMRLALLVCWTMLLGLIFVGLWYTDRPRDVPSAMAQVGELRTLVSTRCLSPFLFFCTRCLSSLLAELT